MALMIEVLPPDVVDPEVMAYITRMLLNIQREIDLSRRIISRSDEPDKPRPGIIYYLTEDIEDIAIEGYYVYINGTWEKLAYE